MGLHDLLHHGIPAPALLVFKLKQFFAEGSLILDALRASKFKILVFLFSILIIMVISGSLMYFVEGPASGFKNIPISLYWAVVTMTTVGYGDIAPQQPLGQFLACPNFKHNEAFSFQVATEDQAETDRYWNAIVGNGGQESAYGLMPGICSPKEVGLDMDIKMSRSNRQILHEEAGVFEYKRHLEIRAIFARPIDIKTSRRVDSRAPQESFQQEYSVAVQLGMEAGLWSAGARHFSSCLD